MMLDNRNFHRTRESRRDLHCHKGVSGNNIVGIHEDTSGNFHGFLYNGSTYSAINVPGATYTETTGVSGNNVIGNSQPGTGRYRGSSSTAQR